MEHIHQYDDAKLGPDWELECPRCDDLVEELETLRGEVVHLREQLEAAHALLEETPELSSMRFQERLRAINPMHRNGGTP